MARRRRHYYIDPRTGRRTRAGFTPFKPDTSPPPGTYDPALDQQLNAAGRGYSDLNQDTEKGLTRGQDDYLLAGQDAGRSLADLARGRSRGLEDLGFQRQDVETGFGRDLGDLGTQRTRATEDYGTSLASLARHFGILGHQQRQSAQAAGVSAGGALAAAKAKRGENQAIERQPIDTSYARFGQDAGTREQRLREDHDRALAAIARSEGRLGEDYTGQVEDVNRGVERAGLGLERYSEDAGTGLSRAGRELGQLGLDVNQTKFFQATQSGAYEPPERPANEHTDPRTGQSFRLVRTPSGALRRLLPTGRLVRRPRYSLRPGGRY